MKPLPFAALPFLLFTACGGRMETVSPGRGMSVEERGPVAKVHPAGRDPVEARHGLWRGFDEHGTRRWEVRYTRGNPAGPYREWDANGGLFATWSYDWDGNLTGWLRWFDDGEPGFKHQLSEDTRPDFDPIGRGTDLLEWAKAQSDPSEEL